MASGATVAYWVVYIVIQIIIAYLAYQALSQDLSGDRGDSELEGMGTNTRSTKEPLRIVYGTHKVGGNDVYGYTHGNNNKRLKLIQTISEGVVSGIVSAGGEPQVFIDDKLESEFSRIKGKRKRRWDGVLGEWDYYTEKSDPIQWTLYHGEADQTYDTNLNDDWTDNQQNTAYISWNFEWDENQFRGMPNREVILQGMLLHDIRSPSNDDAWSDNPVLCLYDFLTNQRYGLGFETEEIDTTTFAAVANYCDTQDWHCNLVITKKSKTAWAYVEDMLRLFRGTLTYFNGVYYLYYADLDLESSVMTIEDKHIVQDQSGKALVTISQPSRFQKPDGMRVTFIDADKEYTSDDVLIGENNGLIDEIQLVGCTDRKHAADIGTTAFERARLNRSINGTFRDDCLLLEPHDIVTFNSTALAIANQTMRVINTTLTQQGLINLTLQYESADLYNDAYDVNIESAYTVDLPDPSVLTVVENVQISETTGDYRLRTFNTLNITFEVDEDDPWFDHVEVWTYVTSAGPVDEAPDVWHFTHQFNSNDNFKIENVLENQTYYVRLLTVNLWGAKQALEDTIMVYKTIVGRRNDPPESLTYLNAIPGNDSVRLVSTKLNDPDIEVYEFRLGTQWTGGIFLSAKRSPHETIASIKPGEHTFTCNTKGTNGLYGEYPQTASVTINDPQGYTDYQDFTDDYSAGSGREFLNTEQISYNSDWWLECSHAQPVPSASIYASAPLSGSYVSHLHTTAFGSPRWYHVYTIADIVVVGASTTWDGVIGSGIWDSINIATRRWQDIFEVTEAPQVKMEIHYKEQSGDDWSVIDSAEILAGVVYAQYFKVRIIIIDPADNLNAYVENYILHTAY